MNRLITDIVWPARPQTINLMLLIYPTFRSSLVCAALQLIIKYAVYSSKNVYISRNVLDNAHLQCFMDRLYIRIDT